MINWQLSKHGIRCPMSHDRIADSSVGLTEVTCFLKVCHCSGHGFSLDLRHKYFHKLLEQAKKSKLRF